MTLAANALQAAIFTRLTSQLPGTPVFDHVPQNTSYPYVMIGDDTAVPSDTKSNDGQEFTVTIHVWDEAAGRKRVKTMLTAIHAALHHREDALVLPGFSVPLIRAEFIDAFQEPAIGGDHFYHGVIRFRVIVRNSQP